MSSTTPDDVGRVDDEGVVPERGWSRKLCADKCVDGVVGCVCGGGKGCLNWKGGVI